MAQSTQAILALMKTTFSNIPMRVLGGRLLLGGLLMLIGLAGCGKGSGSAAVPSARAEPAVKGVEERFTLRVGERTVSVQIAVKPDEMTQGLMFRKAMGADEGMLFVYPVPQKLSFWMRNTVLPLDIGYFDGHGVLKEVYPMYPYDDTRVLSRSSAMKFALEMHQGWYAKNGVRSGAQIDLAAIAAALRARGYKPGSFGANLEVAEKAAQ